jgi:hypothetical protein
MVATVSHLCLVIRGASIVRGIGQPDVKLGDVNLERLNGFSFTADSASAVPAFAPVVKEDICDERVTGEPDVRAAANAGGQVVTT